MVWMSKWLVGSSSMRKFGRWAQRIAKATRDFCPPDKLQICTKNINTSYMLWFDEFFLGFFKILLEIARAHQKFRQIAADGRRELRRPREIFILRQAANLHQKQNYN